MKNKILQISRNCHYLLNITGNLMSQLTATECSNFWSYVMQQYCTAMVNLLQMEQF